MYWLLLLTLLGQTGEVEYGFRDIIEQGESEGGFFVTAFVSIPYASLHFIKLDTSYKADYHIVLQLVDRRKNVYGDEYFGQVILSDPNITRTQSMVVEETLKVVNLPKGNYKAGLSMSTLGSSSRSEKEFEVDLYHRALGSLNIVSANGGRMLNRPFDSRDTLKVSVPLYDNDIDSLVLEIKRPGSSRYRQVLQGNPSLATWDVALVDFSSGDYEVSVTAMSKGKVADSRSLNFRVRNPFVFEASRYNDLVNKLLYITTFEERKQMLSVPPDRRQATWDSFWRTKDPTPQTEYNEELEEYFAKIEYCEQNFSMGDRGYLSDRARVYMKMGAPDEVEEHPFESDTYPYIVWRYTFSGMEFVFEDHLGFGEYTLVYPPGFLNSP